MIRKATNKPRLTFIYSLLLLLAMSTVTCGQENDLSDVDSAPERQILEEHQWESIDKAVEKSLVWLAASQKPDGSFPTIAGGQPGVTSLCVMAFASHGHLPGQGKYGEQLQKSIDYIVDCQKQSGLLALDCPDTKAVPRNVARDTSNNAVYNHAISATVLSEMYGLAEGSDKMADAIEKAIKATLEMQHWPKKNARELGGWRYLNRTLSPDTQSDLSVSAWQIMFLRSAADGGFDVPKERVDEGVAYVLRSFNAKHGTFHLFVANGAPERSRGMAGAGILALAHSGVHDRPETKQAAEYLLKWPCIPYGQDDPLKTGHFWYSDRYHYSAFLATQAMYQMGGKYWKAHFPPTAMALVDNQQKEGSWQVEKHHYDSQFGEAYTTSLALLALGAPNQLLPVFQR